MPVSSASALAKLPDDDLVARARAREPAAFEALIQRYNRRLYRVARGIVGSDVEAEDVLQDAYVQAFSHLDGFAARRSSRHGSPGSFSTKGSADCARDRTSWR
jgi:DNA-directed RNA polymerase specialized sigma24 family protein